MSSALPEVGGRNWAQENRTQRPTSQATPRGDEMPRNRASDPRAIGESDLPDPAVAECVANEFERLRSPKPVKRIVVFNPLAFNPAG
jgi:hypothetical protein